MSAKPAADLPALTGLRGFLALWVVAFHIYYILKLVKFPVGDYLPGLAVHFLEIGGLGVDGFFLLSGFVLAHVYTRDLHGNLTYPQTRRFLLLRLARVYPVHLTLILVYAALKLSGVTFEVETCGVPTLEAATDEQCKRFGLLGLIAQLTLTSTWGWHETLTWNAPAWSISAEWTAYLAFPFLVQWTSRLRNGLASLILAAVSVALLCLYLAARGFKWIEIPIDDVSPARIGFEFVAGMLMYRCYQSSLFARINWSLVSAMCLLAGLGLLQLRAYPAAFVLLFIPFILSLAQPQGWASRVLGSRAMTWLGAVSYSLYMAHILVIDLMGVLAKSAGADESLDVWSAFGMSSGVLAVSLAIAAALYYGVEEPARRRLRRVIEPGR
jgi:peptidoglycan/LPS O-acetylase OafA/YrhL